MSIEVVMTPMRMIRPGEHPLVRGFKRAMRPPDRRPIHEWCENYIRVDDSSPFPGRWRVSRSPWVKDVMEAWRQCRRVVVRCSAQSAKTQMAMNLLCWAISEDPGPAMWVMAAKDEVADFMRDRLVPTLLNCEPVTAQFVAREAMTLLFYTMPVYFTGSNSPSKLQSKPIRFLFLDEVRNYPDGALPLVLKRTRAFWNARELLLSTPDVVGNDLEIEYQEGDQSEWSTLCPDCGRTEPLRFNRMKWDVSPATRREDGRWDFDALAKTIRLECSFCGRVWRDTPMDRRQIANQGRFVPQNPLAPKDRRSFYWNALLPTWVSWRSIVVEYLTSVAAAQSYTPNYETLKKFYNETLGLPWEDALGDVADFGFLEKRRRGYRLMEKWDEEKMRFMAADKQSRGGEHYWWLIRAFSSQGESRLIAYGACRSYEELEEIRKAHGVPLANAMIDSGYRATEVYAWAARSKWKLFKGDSIPHYTVRAGNGAVVRRLWSKTTVDAGIGRRPNMPTRQLPLFRFATDTTKDFLAECYSGMVGEWTLPSDAGEDYLRQLTAERRIGVEDSRGRMRYVWKQSRPDNHLLDCELMVTIAAIINNLLPAGVVRKPAAILPGQTG